MRIQLPGKSANEDPVEIDGPCRIVVVGANGAGKTRFGIWLEDKNQSRMTVHRISAQKALSIPEFAPVKNVEQAEKELLFGRSDQHANVSRKVHDRWGGQPATHLLSDYERLLALLFAKDAERDRLHTHETRQAGAYVPVPESPIDVIVRIWGELMPHRVIRFNDGKVLVGNEAVSEYHAKEMSDGERVALYFLGQCLCAPAGSMVIIDEPELHLHRALVDKLWNRVEELCPDKTIVYITHDLDFAANRIGATKIWARSYDGSAWVWSNLPTDEALPESLVLEIVGNRKPLLFCEGESGGLDHVIYQNCFPHRHVIPRGTASRVIEAVRAMRENAALHEFDAVGVVDRDVRPQSEIDSLESHGVHVLKFAEIENLLCNAELIAEVASFLRRDPHEALLTVTQFVATTLRDERDVQIGIRAEREIRHRLSLFGPTSRDETGLLQEIQTLLGGLRIGEIMADAQADIDEALETGQLNEILRVYNRKSLAERVSPHLGLARRQYPELILRLLRGPDGERIRGHLLVHLPCL